MLYFYSYLSIFTLGIAALTKQEKDLNTSSTTACGVDYVMLQKYNRL